MHKVVDITEKLTAHREGEELLAKHGIRPLP